MWVYSSGWVSWGSVLKVINKVSVSVGQVSLKRRPSNWHTSPRTKRFRGHGEWRMTEERDFVFCTRDGACGNKRKRRITPFRSLSLLPNTMETFVTQASDIHPSPAFSIQENIWIPFPSRILVLSELPCSKSIEISRCCNWMFFLGVESAGARKPSLNQRTLGRGRGGWKSSSGFQPKQDLSLSTCSTR